MKERLIDLFICPACLPEEKRLALSIYEREGADIVSGALKCVRCGYHYPIRDGIAFLLPPSYRPQSQNSPYESSPLISSYLWSHYGDIFNDQDASLAYVEWAGRITKGHGISLDTGCAVGRMTFEMGRKSDFAIGLDNSEGFIRAARSLMTEGHLDFPIPVEGHIMENRSIFLPEERACEKVEFIVGDALAVPFASNSFSCLASLNIVDKIPLPVFHLKEIDRLAKRSRAQFLFSDPFSWSADVTQEKNWLGGKESGSCAGEGIENMLAILKGEKYDLFNPPWKIEEKGYIWWKIRKHRNLFELIRSCFIKARR